MGSSSSSSSHLKPSSQSIPDPSKIENVAKIPQQINTKNTQESETTKNPQENNTIKNPEEIETKNPQVNITKNPEESETNGEEQEKVREANGDEEEEEGECGFCLFMKGGGCKDSFTAWEKCIEEAEEKKEDIVEKCFEVTGALKKCMEVHTDYYAPILQAEKAAEAELEREIEKEKEGSEASSTQVQVSDQDNVSVVQKDKEKEGSEASKHAGVRSG